MLGPLFCDRLAAAPLLPKLRGHFAEFLNNDSLVRLRIFSSSTCVGLRYGLHSTYLATFLASVNSSTSLLVFTPRHHPALRHAYFTACQPHDLDAAPSPRFDYPSVSLLHITSRAGTGISTCCPSPTPFGLGLVPDLPWEDKPSPGNLRHSTTGILTRFSLLMPAFSLPYSPPPLSVRLPQIRIAPLPMRLCASLNFGVQFEPR